MQRKVDRSADGNLTNIQTNKQMQKKKNIDTEGMPE